MFPRTRKPLTRRWTASHVKDKGYKDGLQPESLADGNWLVKQNQPVSKIETKSDKLEESVWVLIQEYIDLKISDTVMTS